MGQKSVTETLDESFFKKDVNVENAGSVDIEKDDLDLELNDDENENKDA